MKRYVITDLHGNNKIWDKIKDYLHNEDILYCLGDSIDRGPNGFRILQELIQRPHTYMIKGNHELMLVDGLKTELHINEAKDLRSGNRPLDLWWYNGGYSTYMDIKSSLSKNQLMDFIDYIDNLPQSIILDSKDKRSKIYLDHSGFTPPYINNDSYWNRTHLKSEWINDPFDTTRTIIIHGHTPVELIDANEYHANGYISYATRVVFGKAKIEDYKPEIITYCGGHKIDLDLGTHMSGRAVLFDLDTFDPIYFSVPLDTPFDNTWILQNT